MDSQSQATPLPEKRRSYPKGSACVVFAAACELIHKAEVSEEVRNEASLAEQSQPVYIWTDAGANEFERLTGSFVPPKIIKSWKESNFLQFALDNSFIEAAAWGGSTDRGCKRILKVVGRSHHAVGEQLHVSVDVVFTAGASQTEYCQCVELILLCHAGDCTYTVTSATIACSAKLQGKTCEMDTLVDL